MDKSNKKSTENWNLEAVKSLATKYDFSKRYIKQMITGDRTPVFADRIKKEYTDLKNQLDAILTNNKI
jgi:hypothetical protein